MSSGFDDEEPYALSLLDAEVSGPPDETFCLGRF